MRKFDCPSCTKSLRWRVLPHVPQSNGQLAFSCVHCGAVLAYVERQSWSARFLLGTKLRRLLTFISGVALLSAVTHFAGRAASLGILAGLAAYVAGTYFLSGQPAYKVLNDRRSNGTNGL
jgi:hypothetical protein